LLKLGRLRGIQRKQISAFGPTGLPAPRHCRGPRQSRGLASERSADTSADPMWLVSRWDRQRL